MNTEIKKYILRFAEISKNDVSQVGGKNASLGEMFTQLAQKGIKVPDGFAVSAQAYWQFLEKNNLLPKLEKLFAKLKTKDIKNLQRIGKSARNLIQKSEFPQDLKNEIITAYQELSEKYEEKKVAVAVRTSGVAEDAPTMSFAGQFETYLNVSGEAELLKAIKKCLTAFFTDRAIVYRQEKGVSQLKFALSVGVQKMVRSDLASAGVIFTLDTETGFKDVILIDGSWGLGEMVVKGRVVPDEWLVFKPTLGKVFQPVISKNLGTKKIKLIYDKKVQTKRVNVSVIDQKKFVLTENEVLTLASWAKVIEDHYQRPMDIEWAKDGQTQQLFIVQARPETIHAASNVNSYVQYILKERGKLLLEGDAVGSKIAAGRVKTIPQVSQIKNFKPGEVLVTRMTDPDWVSVM